MLIIETRRWLHGQDKSSIESYVPNLYMGFLQSIHCQLFHASRFNVLSLWIASIIHQRPDFALFLRLLLKQITQIMEKLLSVYPKSICCFIQLFLESFFVTSINPVVRILSFTTSTLLTIIEENSDPSEFLFITEEIDGVSTLRFIPEFIEYISFYQVDMY